MASPALNKFNIDIDKLLIPQGESIKVLAESMYIEAVKEAITHVRSHLDSVLLDNPNNPDAASKVDFLKQALVKADASAQTIPAHPAVIGVTIEESGNG